MLGIYETTEREAARMYEEDGGNWDSLPTNGHCRDFWREQARKGVPDATLTIEEAAEVLDPPLESARLKALIDATGLQSCGTRRTGRIGRPYRAYKAADLMRLHAAIIPLVYEWQSDPEVSEMGG
jgi:hypothetical protein